MSKVPKALSPGEELFAIHLKSYGISFVREYVFSESRRWRFDFAWPTWKLAVEVEGGTKFGKSRHSRGSGFVNDCRKYNAAALDGWRVLRFTTEMVESGEAIDTIRVAIGSTEPV
jgi:very-short-patch-repair endonuclease